MANLIIKSSADNLVLQGSDASPSMTVGATGTITFAENVTMSGTGNNIGTVTAGTIGSAVTPPANYIFKAYKTSTQSYTSGQWALVTWDADAHSSWNASTSKGFDLTNNYYVTPATGNYLVGISGRMDDAGSGGWIMVLTKNEAPASHTATLANQGMAVVTEHQTSYIDTNSGTTVMALTAGDILRVYVTNNMGGTENLQAGSDGGYQTYFWGYKLF